MASRNSGKKTNSTRGNKASKRQNKPNSPRASPKGTAANSDNAGTEVTSQDSQAANAHIPGKAKFTSLVGMEEAVRRCMRMYQLVVEKCEHDRTGFESFEQLRVAYGQRYKDQGEPAGDDTLRTAIATVETLLGAPLFKQRPIRVFYNEDERQHAKERKQAPEPTGDEYDDPKFKGPRDDVHRKIHRELTWLSSIIWQFPNRGVPKSLVRIACTAGSAPLVAKAIEEANSALADGKRGTGYATAPPKEECIIVMRQDLPTQSRQLAEGGDFHAFCGSVADITNSDKNEKRKAILGIDIPFELMVNRRNRLAQNESVSWQDLAGWLLLHPSERTPPVLFPTPAQVYTQTFQRYEDGLDSVRAAGKFGKVACIAPTLLYPPDKLRNLAAIPIKGLNDVRMATKIYEKVRESESRQQEKYFEAWLAALDEAFEELEELRDRRKEDPTGEVSRDIFNTPHASAVRPGHVGAYFVTRTRSHMTRWENGRLENILFRTDGSFEADHVVVVRKSEKDYPYVYEARGNIYEAGRHYNLDWTAYFPGTAKKNDDRPPRGEEHYHCHFTFEPHIVKHSKVLVGQWNGYSQELHYPDHNFFVLDARYEGATRVPSDICDMVDSFYREHEFKRPLEESLPRPSAERSGDAQSA